ncbi:diaminopimelate decarboxylase [Blochmannia endosymbiont of Camponotus (Colobopsis) obliquus]|uniref:diaminopimelate decarboxylase n=1 Tax=Blochmannia endosymbiont of Camponotus (Colobopsis) obliquus TaxID=1505597 RepID=UPI00061A778A|nr:diaminopimelate decarboxylase [Blochmannia endosymbiont of Camponotus (Colobopsis) obliquus]AKC60428.1 diaminopimelate decarboxylase [Blochmannia endosymbiont of Camponotus (Colobopsis) obliquus]
MLHNIYTTQSALNASNLKVIYQKYNGPVWVYEAEIIINRIKQLQQFDVIRFAQKACSNIHILRLMKYNGVKVDAVSLGEIERALLAGFQSQDDDEIVFTADILELLTLSKIVEFKIPVNAGSIDMLNQLGKCSPGHRVWLRINPGFGHGHHQKTSTGGVNSKHGIWYKDLSRAIECVRRYDLHLVGLHMHIGSGVNYEHLSKVCDAMVEQALTCGEDFTAISAGGGISVPYDIIDQSVNIKHYFSLWDAARQQISQYLEHPIALEIEPGRFIMAESGVLISQVRAVKSIGRRYFVLVDVGFNDFVRPVLYGSYHRISLLPADDRDIFAGPFYDTVIGGPICESGDVFTQDSEGKILPRKLPEVKVGDYLIFHDTGAYGSSMSSNYNSRPLLPEVLFEGGKVREIRRRQLMQELFVLEE